MIDLIIGWAALFVILLPLSAFVWLLIRYIFAWNRGESGEKQTTQLVLWSLTFSFVFLLGLSLFVFLTQKVHHIQLGTWLHSQDYHLEISLLLDGLSLSVATTVALIVILIARFSVNYLHREASYQRFFMIFCLFAGAMQLIILSGTIVIAFMGWELVSISSYLLIAYSWKRTTATNNATRSFITNRLGDVGFILAIFMSLTFFYSSDWLVLFNHDTTESYSFGMGMIAFGLMIASLVKSAQFPTSAWITRALEGPTPSSAVFYGSVMIHTGVFLLLRIHPLLEQIPLLMAVLVLIGMLTVIYAWLCGLVQTDIKTSLVFATLTHVGIMVVTIGLGGYTLATIHLILHAIWRSYQFLHSPSFMQQTTSVAKPVPLWLKNNNYLHHTALNRFWLDPITDWLLVSPTQSLAHDVVLFDDKVLNSISGRPSYEDKLSSLEQLQAYHQGALHLKSNIGKGSGLLGHLMQAIATLLEWFEKTVILKSTDHLLKGIYQIGDYLEIIDRLLRQPRYLLVLIVVTLVIVL